MNSKVILFVLGIGLVMILLTMCSASKGSSRVDNSTVGCVDLDRYEGAWYEIVRKPHTFERDMTDVRATYTRHPNGKIGVRNEGFKHGRPKVAKGSARAGREPGQLMVTFFLFPGEYNIMELGPNYEYSVVGGSNDKYLWVLSRTPQMDPKVLNGIFSRLEERGYNLENIIMVEQD